MNQTLTETENTLTPETPVTLPETLIYTNASGVAVTLPYVEAMTAHAKDGFTGTLRDPAKVEAPKPAPVAASAPKVEVVAPTPQTLTDAGGEAARARNARQMAVVEGLGFAVTDPFFAVGTPLAQSGKDKFRALAVDHSQKPPIEDSCLEAATQIEGEKRTDFTVDLRDIRIDANGQITRGKGSIPLERQAWAAMVAAAAPVLPSARALLEVVDPDLRADIWNRQIVKMPKEKMMKIGVRRGTEGGWQAFRALNGTYPTDAQADKVLRGIASALKGEGMRGSVTYDPASTRVRFEGAWMMPQELDPRVGDIMRVGVAGSTADAANGSFKIGMGITRILCINLTIAEAYASAFRRDHRGDLTGVVEQIAATVKGIPEAFSAFAEDWKIARNTGIAEIKIRGRAYLTVEDALTDLVERGEINALVAKDAMVEHLLRAHSAEPGESLADLLNAVTRAAHEAEWSEFNRQMMEHRAGELLPVLAGYARNAA